MVTSTVWLMGLPCAGKTTIASKLALAYGHDPMVLDGDAFRASYVVPMGFDTKSREAHIHNVATVARDVNFYGRSVVAAFVTPYFELRRILREIIGDRLLLIWVATPLSICEERDTKSMYRKARAGEISNFTGVSDRFDSPVDEADFVIDGRDTNFATTEILDFLSRRAPGLGRAKH